MRVEAQFRAAPSMEAEFGEAGLVPFGVTVTNVEFPIPAAYELVPVVRQRGDEGLPAARHPVGHGGRRTPICSSRFRRAVAPLPIVVLEGGETRHCQGCAKRSQVGSCLRCVAVGPVAGR